MTEKETILTAEGLKKLEVRLEELRSVKRLEVAERIKQAISYGDISENSEYEDAKNEQAFVEGEIISLEKMIRTAKVIDDSNIDTEVVNFGSTVEIYDEEFAEVLTYTLVGSAEADPVKNKISNESPVGAAIVGKRVGDIVEVHVPAWILKYKILTIRR